jgi:hypothetical protein
MDVRNVETPENVEKVENVKAENVKKDEGRKALKVKSSVKAGLAEAFAHQCHGHNID